MPHQQHIQRSFHPTFNPGSFRSRGFSVEKSVNSHDGRDTEARRSIVISSFQQKSHTAQWHAPDPWQLLISVCPSSLHSSQLIRPLSSFQINYKRLGNQSDSIWPWEPGPGLWPNASTLSTGTKKMLQGESRPGMRLHVHNCFLVVLSLHSTHLLLFVAGKEAATKGNFKQFSPYQLLQHKSRQVVSLHSCK